MRARWSCIVFGAFLLPLWLGTGAFAQEPQAAAPEWWQVERDVVAMQMRQKGSIEALVAQVTGSEPASVSEDLFKLSVLMRADMEQEAAACVKRLKKRYPELGQEQISAIYYSACDNYGAWGTAQALVEAYAGNITELALDNRLVAHMLASGWSAQRVDKWMADLAPASPVKSAKRPDLWFAGRRASPSDFWFWARLKFDLDHGMGEARLAEMAAAARARPDDTQRVMAFVQALKEAKGKGLLAVDLAWLPGAVKPKLATEARELAEGLGRLEQWGLALGYGEKAATTPLTTEETGWMSEMISVRMPEETLQAAFTADAAEFVSQCHLHLDRKAEAQQWMVRADDIRKKHSLGRNALFAGQVQAFSGQQVVEGRIQKAEEKSKDDPEYWLERAEYYHGRKEPAQEEAALKQALELVQPKPGRAADWSNSRRQVVSRYVAFMIRVDRRAEAIAMLRAEVEKSPDAAAAGWAVNTLVFQFEKEIAPEDPALWAWLAKRPQWDYTEERLVWRLLENAGPARLEKCLVRAEGLAAGADPSRSSKLGWVMDRMGYAKRAIPLLQLAVEKTSDKEQKEAATFTLLEAYLDSGEWKRAEEIFPKAAVRLSPGEVPDWYSRIALAAAKANAKADAMRLWAEVANLSPGALRHLDQLAEAGLKEELIAFYKAMQKRLPTSQIPARALKELNE